MTREDNLEILKIANSLNVHTLDELMQNYRELLNLLRE